MKKSLYRLVSFISLFYASNILSVAIYCRIDFKEPVAKTWDELGWLFCAINKDEETVSAVDAIENDDFIVSLACSRKAHVLVMASKDEKIIQWFLSKQRNSANPPHVIVYRSFIHSTWDKELRVECHNHELLRKDGDSKK